MRIVTTPMCKEIIEIAGFEDFKVNKNPDNEDGELAILMSEKKTKMNSIVIKLNTINQIKYSIFEVYKHNMSKNRPNLDNEVSKIFEEHNISKWLDKNQRSELRNMNSKIRVMVYTIFLKEIVEDMGFKIINLNIFDLDSKKHKEVILDDLIFIEKNELDVDYLIFPDYFKINIDYLSPKIQEKIVMMPTHSNVSKSPIERVFKRYSILEELSI
ncbi:MAG: hypothetical protein LBR15_10930 [Methanobrevibacter sp.]|jgi:hypothetical protein|nr:hypothetical protein [Candidatus Methanovirga australis]